MNRSRFFLLLILIVCVQAASGQEFITRGASPNLHLMHNVAAKETWYSIGRTYNLAPKDIAGYNKLSTNTPLEIGQSLKIPLTGANFTQNDTKGPGEVLVPVYHVVQEKEWMYRISVNHNKVPIEKLEKWNSIGRDEAKAGMKLIVGHLRMKAGGNAVAAAQTAQQKPQPAEPARTSTQSSPENPSPTTGTTATNVSDTSPGAGYFQGMFANTGKSSSGVAGIFKSTSGWSDGKYYALLNNVTVGTIVKITFPPTKKVIYAKVLGELPEMKESAGLALRISDAAAKELGAVSSKFSVDVAY